MYKKEAFRHLDKKYNSTFYSGMLGILMSYCHRKLEVFKKRNENFDKILEIGAGSAPHFKYINDSYNEYHIAETSDYASSLFQENEKVKLKKYDAIIISFNKRERKKERK